MQKQNSVIKNYILSSEIRKISEEESEKIYNCLCILYDGKVVKKDSFHVRIGL